MTDDAVLAPDLEYWGSMAGWNTAEAAALFLDIEPYQAKSWQRNDPNLSDVQRAYFKLRFRLRRAETMDALSSPLPPREAVEWAKSNGIKVSEELKDCVRGKRGLKNWHFRYRKQKQKIAFLESRIAELEGRVSDDPNPRRLKVLYKIVLGLAVARFRFNEDRRKTTGMILSALQQADYPVDTGTIKDCLDTASEIFKK